ncbi:DUF927 domain-containing protein [Mesorhizobium sp. CC13]|uniref:DUF927 domain-containing protein n=1 Tax=Mesorhizobium sp. CC13 TaxID=3029194 RepID=UPI0032661879
MSSKKAADFRVTKEQISEDNVRYLHVSFPTNEGVGDARVPRGALTEVGRAKTAFANAGAILPDDPAEVFKRLLMSRSHKIERITGNGGWHDDQFVTVAATYSRQKSKVRILFDPDHRAATAPQQAGDVASFIEGVKPFLEASDYLLFSYILGLAAPLGARIGRGQGFTASITQVSGSGKTLCIRLAHALGNHAEEEDLQNFADTMGVFLDNLPAFGGRCLGFGDIKASTSMKEALTKLKALVFNASAKSTKKRLNERPKPNPQFLIPFVSAERPLIELFMEEKIDFDKGDTARIIELHPPKAEEGGIFAGKANSIDLALELERFLACNYGTVLPRWAKVLSKHRPTSWTKWVEEKEASFLADVGNLSPRYARIVKHFAFMAATGGLLVRLNALPVSQDRVTETMRQLFWKYVETLERDDSEARQRWLDFFDFLDDETALPLLAAGKAPSIKPKNGFRRKEGGMSVVYLKRQSIIPLFGSASVVDSVVLPLLLRHECLTRTPTGDLTVPVKQSGLGRSRYYRLSVPKLLQAKAEIVG